MALSRLLIRSRRQAKPLRFQSLLGARRHQRHLALPFLFDVARVLAPDQYLLAGVTFCAQSLMISIILLSIFQVLIRLIFAPRPLHIDVKFLIPQFIVQIHGQLLLIRSGCVNISAERAAFAVRSLQVPLSGKQPLI